MTTGKKTNVTKRTLEEYLIGIAQWSPQVMTMLVPAIPGTVRHEKMPAGGKGAELGQRVAIYLDSHSARVTKSLGSTGFIADFLLPYPSLKGFRDAEGLLGRGWESTLSQAWHPQHL